MKGPTWISLMSYSLGLVNVPAGMTEGGLMIEGPTFTEVGAYLKSVPLHHVAQILARYCHCTLFPATLDAEAEYLWLAYHSGD